MKKILTVVAGLMIVALLQAQTLEEIVKNYSAANKLDKVAQLSTIRISAKMSMMGMDMPMELWMKNPDKIKSQVSMNGQDVISVFDGTKGYTVNPMSGSAEPIEMTPDQIKQTQNSNMFKNQIANEFKEGKLTLLGEENVNDKPNFKLKADLGNGNSSLVYIDKSTYLISKTVADVNANGMSMTVETYPTDYKDFDGLIIPMKTTSSAQGMDFSVVFDKVEVNVPMEDSIFAIKK